jgi:hypothetical protein
MSAYKVLGQVNPTTTGTLTALYAVPLATQAFCSTLSICNQGASTSSARVAVQPLGAGILPRHYILYDTVIQPQDTLFLTIGIALGQTDQINVSAATSSVSFSLFGSEI